MRFVVSALAIGTVFGSISLDPPPPPTPGAAVFEDIQPYLDTLSRPASREELMEALYAIRADTQRTDDQAAKFLDTEMPPLQQISQLADAVSRANGEGPWPEWREAIFRLADSLSMHSLLDWEYVWLGSVGPYPRPERWVPVLERSDSYKCDAVMPLIERIFFSVPYPPVLNETESNAKEGIIQSVRNRNVKAKVRILIESMDKKSPSEIINYAAKIRELCN
jgi:hypothetical protein